MENKKKNSLAFAEYTSLLQEMLSLFKPWMKTVNTTGFVCIRTYIQMYIFDKIHRLKSLLYFAYYNFIDNTISHLSNFVLLFINHLN